MFFTVILFRDIGNRLIEWPKSYASDEKKSFLQIRLSHDFEYIFSSLQKNNTGPNRESVSDVKKTDVLIRSWNMNFHDSNSLFISATRQDLARFRRFAKYVCTCDHHVFWFLSRGDIGFASLRCFPSRAILRNSSITAKKNAMCRATLQPSRL